MKKSIIFAILAVAIAAVPARAQFDETNNLFYHSFRTPQANGLNPAFFPANNRFFMQLPGVELQFGGPLAINDVMHYDEAQKLTVIDINRILNALDEDHRIRLGVNAQLFGFGINFGRIFVTFNARAKASLSFGLPTNAVNTLLKGNVDDNGNPISELVLMDGDLFNAQAYIEASLGAAYTFRKLGLTVGVRPKLLLGGFNAQSDKTRVTFNTADGFDNVSASMYYEIMASSPVAYDTINKKFGFKLADMLKLGNLSTGMALDLGARYEMGPFTFSAAINDLSTGIHWKNNVISFKPKNGQGSIRFDGVDVTNMFSGGQMNTDTLISQWQEELDGMTPEVHTEGEADYWYPIPTTLNLGASFSFAKLFRAGLLLHGQWDRGLISKKNDNPTGFGLVDNVNTFRFNTTLSVGVNLFNWLEVLLGSSVVYDGSKLSPLNPGAGIVLTPATIMQIYFMGDYVSNIYLADTKAFNVKFGLNVLIGKGRRNVVSAVVAD